MTLLQELKKRAHHLKGETFALYLAARDPRTPWYAKLLVAGIAAYAFSPVDLIPDFVPLPGYLDDLILIPAGIPGWTRFMNMKSSVYGNYHFHSPLFC
jgi:uncharacterized membrane protein YkvA (DUF1232 family)